MLALAGLALVGAPLRAADVDNDAQAKRTPTGQLEKVVVVGSRLPAAEAQTAQDIHIYERERIETDRIAAWSHVGAAGWRM